jgi:hypothetical protein
MVFPMKPMFLRSVVVVAVVVVAVVVVAVVKAAAGQAAVDWEQQMKFVATLLVHLAKKKKMWSLLSSHPLIKQNKTQSVYS